MLVSCDPALPQYNVRLTLSEKVSSLCFLDAIPKKLPFEQEIHHQVELMGGLCCHSVPELNEFSLMN